MPGNLNACIETDPHGVPDPRMRFRPGDLSVQVGTAGLGGGQVGDDCEIA